MSTSRKGKPIVYKRAKSFVQESNLFLYFDQVFEHFLSMKKSLGVRERTNREYGNLINWFRDWLSERYPDLNDVEEKTTSAFGNISFI